MDAPSSADRARLFPELDVVVGAESERNSGIEPVPDPITRSADWPSWPFVTMSAAMPSHNRHSSSASPAAHSPSLSPSSSSPAMHTSRAAAAPAGYAGNSHSIPTAADMELLDLLTAMPSVFPHSGHGPSSPSSASYPTGPVIAGKRRPLATLAALRRPPIDPIILAASLSSGPQVTRHHFHHSYGDKAGRSGGGHGASHQMPASQRKALEVREADVARANKSRSATTGNVDSARRRASSVSRKRRSQSVTGSYANCDYDDADDEDAEGDDEVGQDDAREGVVDDVPEVTPSEAALYASKQAPRSVRLQREAEERKAREAALEQRKRDLAQQEEAKKTASAAKEEVQRASHIRASDEPASQDVTSSRLKEKTSGTQALLKQALSERQAIASAPTTPSLPATPGEPNANPFAAAMSETAQGQTATQPFAPQLARLSSIVRPPPLQVRCYARTRIPTPHGEIFCHLYRNNHDTKEHLALVVDPAQNESDVPIEQLARPRGPKSLRSKTLDEKWSQEETDMERIVRGAYVGRLGPTCQVASQAPNKAGRGVRSGDRTARRDDDDNGGGGGDGEWEAPLVRIHSECYTGETIGSQRCDCGEQLDEALRLILHSGTGVEPEASTSSPKRPRLPRGVVVYLRQEGRGIGLLDKLMAYNLQDMGHDTVSANVLLGHLPDARRYAAAAAILEDLGVDQCRLLTNNPEKMEAMEGEGIGVTERVGMIPRAWLADMHGGKKKKKHSSRKSASKRHGGGGGKGRRAKTSSSRPKKGRVSELASSTTSSDFPHSSNLASSILSQDDGAGEGQRHRQPSSSSMMDEHELGARHQGSDIEHSQVYDDDEEDTGTESTTDSNSDSDSDVYQQHLLRSNGATLIGGAATRGPELEKYLRTKVERMGHLLDLPPEQAQAQAAQRKRQQRAGANEGGDDDGEEEEEDVVLVQSNRD